MHWNWFFLHSILFLYWYGYLCLFRWLLFLNWNFFWLFLFLMSFYLCSCWMGCSWWLYWYFYRYFFLYFFGLLSFFLIRFLLFWRLLFFLVYWSWRFWFFLFYFFSFRLNLSWSTINLGYNGFLCKSKIRDNFISLLNCIITLTLWSTIQIEISFEPLYKL